MKNGRESALRNGKMPKISDLLPSYEKEWLSAIDEYIRDAFEAAGEA
jgi:hypothetical protein